MTYTKQQRKAIAKVFKAARKVLWNGKPGTAPNDNHPVHICEAISVTCDQWTSASASARATNVIMIRLGDFAYVESWLYAKGCIPHGGRRDDACIHRIQKWRKEWLRRLIKEFSS